MTDKEQEKRVSMKQSSGLHEFIGSGKRQRNKKNQKPKEVDDITRLQVEDIFEIKKLKFIPNVWKDGKKLEKLLSDMCKCIN